MAKYRDLPVARKLFASAFDIDRQIIYLLATDKSRYFAQPRPIIVYYLPMPKAEVVNCFRVLFVP